MGCGVPWHRWHCLCCLPKRGKGTWLGWAWAWGLLNVHRGCSRQGLTPRADQDMEGVIVSFCLISRGNKPNAIILPGIINFSRNPQKSVSSEVEGNWVETGGQMEMGRVLLGHKETGESFRDAPEAQLDLASSWVSMDCKIPIHTKWGLLALAV